MKLSSLALIFDSEQERQRKRENRLISLTVQDFVLYAALDIDTKYVIVRISSFKLC